MVMVRYKKHLNFQEQYAVLKVVEEYYTGEHKWRDTQIKCKCHFKAT